MISKTVSQAFLLSLTALMGLVYWLTYGSESQAMLLSVAGIVLIGLSLAIERKFPQHRRWNEGAGDTACDLWSLVFVAGVLDGALKWVMPFAILALLPEIGMASVWPMWVQIVLATALIELGAWASHYAHHRFAPLWKLHLVHHSPERLYTLNNFRFHPLNYILNHLAMFVPLLAIGISPEALMAYAALALPVLVFQHTNAAFDFGALNLLFNTNEIHRWHHSTELREGMSNFGRAFVIWDLVFGTYHNPSNRSEPAAVGLSPGQSPSPRVAAGGWQQFLWPLKSECCR
jgi:sterol desaturase/sphingolipid hydroxylase (fatty acid hydroxylase superfamily)